MEIYLQILIIFGIVGSFNSPGVYCLECYKCTSNERADCAIKPSEKISVVTCRRERDTCATGIFNKITHRGCLSDMPNGVCSSYGSNPCVQCKSHLCNGQFYPADRRSCYQCLGSECINVTKSKIKSTPCRNYVKNDSCYTDIVGIQMTVRGCASDGKNACKNMKCLSCNYDGCNNLVGVSEINCYSCSYIKNIGNSNKDLSCKRPQNASDKCLVSNITTCVEKVLLGDKGKCYTSYNEQTDVAKRGCLSTSGAVGIGNDKLTECYGDLCNSECVGIKCIICDSSKNPKCHNQATYLKVESCPEGTNHCFACETKDGHVVRGCNNEENIENLHCNFCYDEDGCNRGNVRTCYKCVSSSNPNCAYWLNMSSIDLEVCDNPLDNCVVTALPNSYTIRGCQSKVPECTPGDPVCKRCNGSLCNDGIVPENRKFCHQCSDSTECDKKQDTSKALPCLNYSLNDYCFAYANDNNSITRGCSSDVAYNDCRRLPNGKCRICYDNGCNSWQLIRKPTLSCIKCNETDDICAWGQEKESAKLCSSQVPYFSDETCFTYEHSKTNVDRGCTLDFPNHLVENERVHLCKSPGCNNQHKIIQSCIQCNSKGDEACKGTAVNVSATDCRKDSLQLFKNRGCYVMKTAEGDVFRGCVFDLTNDELQACKTNKNQCIYCAGQGCNKQKPPSLASKIQQCSYLFIMLPCVLLYITSRK